MRASYLALPLTHVIEVMRPLPIQPLPGTPPAVLGACVMRGSAVPVVDANRLFGAAPVPFGRFVALRSHERRMALAVEAIAGTVRLADQADSGLPDVLRGGLLAQLGSFDSKLLLVLETARLLPAESASALESHERVD